MDDADEVEEVEEVTATVEEAVTAAVALLLLVLVFVLVVDEVLDTSDKAVSSLLKSGGGVAYIEAAIFGITINGAIREIWRKVNNISIAW